MEKIKQIQNRLRKTSEIDSSDLYSSLYTLNKLLEEKLKNEDYIKKYNEKFYKESVQIKEISDDLINIILNLMVN